MINPKVAVSSPQSSPAGEPEPAVPRGLSIGLKVSGGFALLVALLLLVAGRSYFASTAATQSIESTADARLPIANASARAQANLLRMISDVRAYLALGDSDRATDFRTSYQRSRTEFATNLNELESLSTNFTPENQERFEQLKAAFVRWSDSTWEAYPERLFELRDDQIEREPAFRLLTTEGGRLAGNVLIDTGQLIASQSNTQTLKDLAQFQGSFAAVFSGLRGYVTTRNRSFLLEYEENLAINKENWNQLQRDRAQFTSSQQVILDRIAANRAAFLSLPSRIISRLESNHWREDLYLFSQEMLPLANQMQQLLDQMTTDDQLLLESRLNAGRQGLVDTNRQTLISIIIALLLAGGLSMLFTARIAGPVRRLTLVAQEVQSGNFNARARVESGDEIGVLARTFNNMTRQIQHNLSQIEHNLVQIRQEKKRADDLLTVVIPIGVALANEKDFNRLLESILVEAQEFCYADAGILYLREDQHLNRVIVRNTSLHVALGGTTGRSPGFAPLALYEPATQTPNCHSSAVYATLKGISVNIADMPSYQGEVPFTAPDIFNQEHDYQTLSLLSIPLRNSEGRVIGVLELINAQDPEAGRIIPFDSNLQQMMESLSSLAVAALEAYIREQSLRQEIQELRIEIDETRRKKQVSEIVDTELFQDLRSRAQGLRERRRRGEKEEQPDPAGDRDKRSPQG